MSSSAERFRAVVVEEKTDDAGPPRLSAELREIDLQQLRTGDSAPSPDDAVLIDVAYSSLNFKDGLAVSGRPGVTRSSPIVAGIDLVGTVAESADARWKPGDLVLVNGAGLSETRNGGYAERALVAGEHLVRVPDPISSRQAAAIGTAGFT